MLASKGANSLEGVCAQVEVLLINVMTAVEATYVESERTSVVMTMSCCHLWEWPEDRDARRV